MTANTVKLISPERVKKLFECYGPNPDSWPLDEKVSALSLIQHSGELQELQREIKGFEKLIETADVSQVVGDGVDQELLNRIVGALPEQDSRPDPRFSNRRLRNNRPFFDLNRTMGAVAASVAVVAITLSIVTLKPENVRPVSSVTAANTELDNWMWEQVFGEPVDDSEEPLSMMTLLEMEEI